MKKILIITGAAIVMLCASCVKEKNCRCSVLGKQDVRIITIERGDCSKINYASYTDDLDTVHVDSVLCTDYPFSADSLVVER